MAGLSARDRGRPLRDRRHGQGGRPLLPLPAVEADARQPPRLAPHGRRRPRRHQCGAGRLRREGDGPPRTPARPRRRGVPPGQPRPAAGRRHGQRVLQGRRRTDVRDAGGPAEHWGPRAPPPRAPSLDPDQRHREVGARAGDARPHRRAARRAGRGAGAHVVRLRLRLATHREGAVRLRHRGARPRGVRADPLGLLGGEPRRGHRPRLAQPRRTQGQVRRHHRRVLGHRPGHRAQGRPVRRHPGPGRPRQGQARGDPGHDRAARRQGPRLPVRPVGPRGDRHALRADHRPSCRRSTSSSTTPAGRSAARSSCRTTGSTTSSARCSSTTSGRSGWSWG